MKHKLILIAMTACLGLPISAQSPAKPSNPIVEAAPKPEPKPLPPSTARRPGLRPLPRGPEKVESNRPRVVLPPRQADPFTADPVKRPAPAPATDPFGGTPPKRPTPRATPVDRPALDPFGSTPAPTPAPRAIRRATSQDNDGGDLSMSYETFSLDIGSAADLMRRKLTNEKLYKTLVELAGAGSNKIAQDTLIVLTLRTGTRGSTSSISEHIYPTEYDPPNTPTAYEVRNIGITVEAEADINPKNGAIDLNIAPEHVSLVGNSEWGPGDAKQEMPEFECQQLKTTTQLLPDVPRLLGTINRPPNSKADKSTSGRIWFAFVTVSHVE